MSTKAEFHPFTYPVIMAGRDTPQAEKELFKQINLLIDLDTGLAQPCHCEEHSPEKCQADREELEAERNRLAESIRNALML